MMKYSILNDSQSSNPFLSDNFHHQILALGFFWPHRRLYIYVQSAKILLLPSKYEINMVPSIHSIFQYCNIGLFFIARCKVITLNSLCILLSISSLLLFFMALSLSKVYRSSNYRDSDGCRSFLKAIAKRIPFLFVNAFKSDNYMGSNIQ